MGTTFAEIITDYAMVEIDDIRLQEQLDENPARFFRRMTLYVRNAVPYFTTPPQMTQRLMFQDAQWDDFQWRGTASASQTVVQTGKTGYQLCSIMTALETNGEEVFWAPYRGANYDPQTGEVTFPPGIADGQIFDMDFYTDWQFDAELNSVEKRILGLCVALVWYERFSTNWLNMQPKIQDQSFSVGSESGHIRAMTERAREFRHTLNSEIRKYEQNLSYQNTVLHKGMFPPFF